MSKAQNRQRKCRSEANQTEDKSSKSNEVAAKIHSATVRGKMRTMCVKTKIVKRHDEETFHGK